MCNILFGIGEQYFLFWQELDCLQMLSALKQWQQSGQCSCLSLFPTHTLRDVQAEQSQCFRDFYPSRGFIC